jgi:hypothetical protein
MPHTDIVLLHATQGMRGQLHGRGAAFVLRNTTFIASAASIGFGGMGPPPMCFERCALMVSLIVSLFKSEMRLSMMFVAFGAESICGESGAGGTIPGGRCGDEIEGDLPRAACVFATRCAACSLRFCSFSARSFSFSASRCTFLSMVLNFETIVKNSSGVVVRGSSAKKVTTSVNAVCAEANSESRASNSGVICASAAPRAFETEPISSVLESCLQIS